MDTLAPPLPIRSSVLPPPDASTRHVPKPRALRRILGWVARRRRDRRRHRPWLRAGRGARVPVRHPPADREAVATPSHPAAPPRPADRHHPPAAHPADAGRRDRRRCGDRRPLARLAARARVATARHRASVLGAGRARLLAPRPDDLLDPPDEPRGPVLLALPRGPPLLDPPRLDLGRPQSSVRRRLRCARDRVPHRRRRARSRSPGRSP